MQFIEENTYIKDLSAGWSRLCVIQINITVTQKCDRRIQDKLKNVIVNVVFI